MASNVSTTSYSYLQTASGRINGLASGIDTESIVSKLMKAASAPMEQLQKQKQTYEWQRDAYRDVNTKLSTFKDTIFDKFGLHGSLSSKTVSVSNSDKVSVTATPSATGTLNLQNIAQLATVASANKTLSKYAPSAKLSEFNVTSTSGTFNYSVGVKNYSISYSKDNTLSEFVEKLKANGLPGAKAEDGQLSLGSNDVTVIDSNFSLTLADKLGFLDRDTNNKIKTSTLGISKTTKLSELGLMDGTVVLNVLQSDGTTKPTTVNYKKDDTINTFLTNLNNSGAGITALFANGKMSITSNATGYMSGGAISVKSDTNGANGNGVFQKLKFLTGASGEIANGQNAKYTVNGLDMESTSNTFTVSGYNVTLKGEYNKPVVSETPPISISSSTNIDAMVDKIKDYMKTYNDLITSLNDKINESKNRDYSPLTDAQKAEMTQDQITKWEEKAKSGIIRSDSNVRNVLSNLRSAVYNTVDGVDEQYNALYKIGITTTSTWSDGGKLQLDENKLRTALSANPDSVINLFTKSDDADVPSTDKTTDANHDSNPNTGMGVIAQMRKAAQDGISAIETTAGKPTSVDNNYALGKQLVDVNSKISDWKKRLADMENQYWKQFSAMETAIQNANAQSAFFMGQ